MESLRIFSQIPEPEKTAFLTKHFDEIVSFIFPIPTSFPQFMFAQFNLFLRICGCVADSCNFFVSDTFRVAFRNFLVMRNPRRVSKAQRLFRPLLHVLIPAISSEFSRSGNLLILSAFFELFCAPQMITPDAFLAATGWLLGQMSDPWFAKVGASIGRFLTAAGIVLVPPELPGVLPSLLSLGGFDDFIAHFRSDLSFRVVAISAVAAAAVDAEGGRFWELQRLLLLLALSGPDEVADIVDPAFARMGDFLEGGLPLEAPPCLELAAELVGRIEAERVERWPNLLFALLIEGPVASVPVRRLLLAVLRALPAQTVVDMFPGFVEVDDEQAEDRWRLFFEAREELARELAAALSGPGPGPEWLSGIRGQDDDSEVLSSLT
jgi:hypothetical protein